MNTEVDEGRSRLFPLYARLHLLEVFCDKPYNKGVETAVLSGEMAYRKMSLKGLSGQRTRFLECYTTKIKRKVRGFDECRLQQ